MRILEARFHPIDRHASNFVLVGHVVWDEQGTPSVRAAPALQNQTAPATMLATLNHLVRMTAPNSFEGLQALRNRFWSFVRPRESA